MSTHIENCPFCGGASIKPYEYINEPTDSYCQCADCGTIGPSGKEASKESAVAAWNRRAALHAQQGEAKDVRQDGGDAAHQEPVPEGWQVTHMPPWDALTDEAQEQQRICVQRLVAPFCDATGLRVWSGPTLEAAMQSAHAALKLPYKASAAPAVAQGAKDAPAPADWREHAALACYGERVAADETKSPEDAAYNQAIENCMDAIRNLDDVAQCSTKPAPATLAVDLDALDIAYKHHTGHEVKKAVWLEDVRALLAAAGSSQWQDEELNFLEQWLSFANEEVQECCGESRPTGVEYMGSIEYGCCNEPVLIPRDPDEVIAAMQKRHAELIAALAAKDAK